MEMEGHESASRMSEEAAEEAREPENESGWTTDSVSGRPSENGGVIVSVSQKRQMKNKGGMGPYSDYRTKDYVFSTPEEAGAFFAQHVMTVNGTSGNQPVPSVRG